MNKSYLGYDKLKDMLKVITGQKKEIKWDFILETSLNEGTRKFSRELFSFLNMTKEEDL